MAADGTWNLTLQAPTGKQRVDLTLVTDGAALRGHVDAPLPLGKVEFSDGTVDGDKLAWVADVTSPIPVKLEFTATVSGDTISGIVKMGTFGNARFEGPRA